MAANQNQMLIPTFKALRYYPYLFFWIIPPLPLPALFFSYVYSILAWSRHLVLEMLHMLTQLPLLGSPYSQLEFLVLLYNSLQIHFHIIPLKFLLPDSNIPSSDTYKQFGGRNQV